MRVILAMICLIMTVWMISDVVQGNESHISSKVAVAIALILIAYTILENINTLLF